jgi:hypothetical protein
MSVRQAVHVARMGAKGKKHLKGVSVDGRIIFKQILRKLYGAMWTRFTWLEI